MDFVIESQSREATLQLGRALGMVLQGGDILALAGDLGAGKTVLAQGIAQGLGITAAVTSPTFTLIQEYAATSRENPLRLIHMDLYRLQHPDEVEVIGVEDAFQRDTICLIEWPEIAEDFLPDDCLRIRIQGNGEDPRMLTFRYQTRSWQNRLEPLWAEQTMNHQEEVQP